MIDSGLDPADRASFVRVQWRSQRHFEPPQQTWTAPSRVAWRRPRRPLADRRSGGLTNFLPSGDARCQYPAHAGDGGWPSARRPQAWNWVPVASRRMSSRHAN